MKTILTLVLALLFFSTNFAQNGINYKAVIKDSNGNVIANQQITVRFTILRGVARTPTYSETHMPTTDTNGLIIVNIGEGTPSIGDFTTINWGSDSHYLGVEVNTGTGLVNFGTTEFKAVPYALNVTGLEALDEGNGIGWRLKGRDPILYGNIGVNAVDFSYNQYVTSRGATGNRSFAMGSSTHAFGDRSTAMGSGSKALGIVSTAMGVSTEASGDNSVAMCDNSKAVGRNSTALGYYTSATSDTSTAIGRWNVVSGDSLNWIPTDPLFEIGNGISSASRSNALTVLKNGNVGIGNNMPASLLEVNHKNITPTLLNFRNALSIKNDLSKESWQLFVDYGGTLLLYRKGAYRGYFNSTSGAYVQASDVRLKKDILPLEASTLQKVMQLNPVSYQMKDQNNDERQIGLISQEVQEIFPSITHLVPGQDVLALSYTELIPILIKAIQEQQKAMENLKARIVSLENE